MSSTSLMSNSAFELVKQDAAPSDIPYVNASTTSSAADLAASEAADSSHHLH